MSIPVGSRLFLQTADARVVTVASTGSTRTLDLNDGNVFDMTMNVSCAFTISNPVASGSYSEFVLILRGAFTPSFTNTVDTPANAAIAYTTPSAYGLFTVNGGTNWWIVSLGANFS